MTVQARGYATLFHRHSTNPILTAADLALSGPHGLQCRRDAAA